ncbi:hypothetical protein N7478_008166 [Penicillium angulare]|uniref:uncharacterized protein n=1 Tax=Penicillium angulare TaxID=116970 RepID=UPI0025411FD6|nr:uncharacterized protein N7478_008166 [Penicillium angulare]KAJ5273041.1 hypothetical protein N7478_008166 [Penicillium angulare]
MMNRFRKNKKAKEVKEISASDDLENGPSPLPFSLKLSKKKDVPEEEPKLQLADALPSSDDFRTSLLMPKLSARFSMLREQDDPASLIGKASDDSVLFPKRASRLNLFGHAPAMLTDIDELSSNDGSRPSLALGRTDSYASGGDAGYGTDDDRSHGGSIMSRARRADGNNLFGGRQKVYRIPVRSPGGPSSPASETQRGMGKAVYEHDLNMSAFQRMRLQQKQQQQGFTEELNLDIATPDSEDTPSVSSANRTTFSSTASGPTANARSSTAATSIDESHFNPSQSQPSESPADVRPPFPLMNPRPGSVRSRRLYGQGLTQNVQSQQNSTLHRLESLSRQRSGTPDLLNRNYSRSASNLRDRLQKLAINEPTASRPTSPPSSATSPKQLYHPEPAPKDHVSPTASNFGAPPLSPPSSETGDGNSLLAAALSPEDRGKATAMGLFNRPATGFDEQQFVRRQLQMHQGRETPPPRRPSSPRRMMSQEQPTRPRGLSKSSYRSRAESASSHYSSDAHHGLEHSRASSVEASPRIPGARTFYAASTDDSGDERDDHQSYEVSSITSQATDYGPPLHQCNNVSKPPTPTGEHHLESLPEVRYSDLGDLKPIEENEIPEEDQPLDITGSVTPERPDSPTIQASEVVHNDFQTRLRSASEQSSDIPPSPLRLPVAILEPKKHEPEISVVEVQPSPTSEDHLRVDTVGESTEPETSSNRDSSRQSGEVMTSRGSEDSSNSSDTGLSGRNVPTWEQELSYHHRRDGSTETQREREEFAMEIAERRRKIQEKLRSVAESESRSSSPTPSQHTPDSNVKTGNAFSLLKHKSNKQGVSKADLYGFNSSSTPSLVPDDLVPRDDRPSVFSRHSNSSVPQISSERSFRSRMPTLSRSASRESSHSRGTSPQPGYRAPRDRSGSDASGRSKSRTRYRDRDDLETVEEGAVIAHENFVAPENFEPYIPPSVPGSARPSLEGDSNSVPFDRSTSAASGRYRSASRSGTPSFQYERPFQFNQAQAPASSSMIGASPRPSPATPAYSANATPPLNEDASPTTSLSSSSAASSQALPQRAPGHNLLHKRAVNKKIISEPTFVSCTSNVPTVGLQNGAAAPPPLPPMNPRRRRGTQTILSAFKPDSSRVSSPAPSISDETSAFAFDDEKRPRSRSRLRKKSIEGGDRERVAMSPPPALPVPHYPPPAIPVNGGMF